MKPDWIQIARRFSPLLVLAVSLVPTGCTTPKFKPETDVPQDKVLVYIYRKAYLSGIAGNHHIFVNGQPITSLHNGSYCSYLASLGTNSFNSKAFSPAVMIDMTMNASFKDALLELNAEAGKTYYIQFKIATTWGPKMVEMDADTGAREIAKCRLAKPL
jgi:Protein of unknown function (DUF2846)